MGIFKRQTVPSTGFIEDDKVLQILVQNGADLSKPRTIWHYLYGESAEALSQAAEELRSNGYTVEVSPSAETGNFLCLAERVQVVDYASTASERKHFQSIALQVPGGDYDGWESTPQNSI